MPLSQEEGCSSAFLTSCDVELKACWSNADTYLLYQCKFLWFRCPLKQSCQSEGELWLIFWGPRDWLKIAALSSWEVLSISVWSLWEAATHRSPWLAHPKMGKENKAWRFTLEELLICHLMKKVLGSWVACICVIGWEMGQTLTFLTWSLWQTHCWCRCLNWFPWKNSSVGVLWHL